MAIYWLHIRNEVINSLIKYKVSIFDKGNYLRKHKKSNKNVNLINNGHMKYTNSSTIDKIKSLII